MQINGAELVSTSAALEPDKLERVNGAGGPSLSPSDLGAAAGQGIEGTFKALNQSDAPGWSGFANSINSFNQNYNPIYWGLNGANNYFNPSPGNGAPGDTYIPASMNSSGGIDPGGFAP
jgi:hypothetical protein